MKECIIFLFSVFYFLFSVYTFAEEIEYTAQELHDPFASVLPKEIFEVPKEISKEEIPISEGLISLPTFNIQGLIWGSPNPQAIINGKVLKVGDTIEGAKIINISKNGIDIIYEGRLFSLLSPGKEILEKNEEEK